jgi:4-amino-4-deoxy-L-arabinose transferase-like glycosyltransferase
LQGWLVRETTSATFDESIFLEAAAESMSDGAGLDQHLTELGVAPVPVVIAWLPAVRGSSQGRLSSEAAAALEVARLRTARVISCAVAGVSLILVVFLWMLRRRGLAAGTMAGVLCAFSPTVLAHATLATTDAWIACTALVGLAALSWLGRQETSVLRWLVASAAAGTAVAAKYSGVFLFQVAAVMFTMTAWRERGPTSPQPTAPSSNRLVSAVLVGLRRTLLLGSLAFLACWAWHGFGSTALTPKVSRLFPRAVWAFLEQWTGGELPSPAAGFLFQLGHSLDGHDAYLLGEYRKKGWWYYFPLAAFFKSTPSELLLGLALGGWALKELVGWCRPWWNRQEAPAPPDARLKTEPDASADLTPLVWGTAVVVVSLSMLTVQVQIGQRYLLPLYPLVVLLGTEWLYTRRGRLARWRSGVAAMLVAGQVVSAAAIAPQHLAYFSPLVGGPANARALLADSNVDWGQDLPRLKTELDRRGWRRILLSYFGTADPSAYGISATMVNDLSRLDSAIVAELDRYDGLAVSLTYLLGVYANPPGPNRALLEIPPAGRAGYSIFIYDLRDERVRAALRGAESPGR